MPLTTRVRGILRWLRRLSTATRIVLRRSPASNGPWAGTSLRSSRPAANSGSAWCSTASWWWNDGRLDFAALQRRLRPRAASLAAVAGRACFVIFDLLAWVGVDLLARPYRERRWALERLPAGLVLVPLSCDVADAEA
jgi:hypothetical protein